MKSRPNERWFAGGAGVVLMLSVLWFGYRSVVSQPSQAMTASPSLQGEYDYAEEDIEPEVLNQLLVLSDLVKFAKEQPLANENEMSLINAIEFVQNTKQIINEEVPPLRED